MNAWRLLLNAWPTGRRVAGIGRRACVFGCSDGADDVWQHYLGCPVLVGGLGVQWLAATGSRIDETWGLAGADARFASAAFEAYRVASRGCAASSLPSPSRACILKETGGRPSGATAAADPRRLAGALAAPAPLWRAAACTGDTPPARRPAPT